MSGSVPTKMSWICKHWLTLSESGTYGYLRTAGDDALQADEVAEEPRGEGAGCHVLRPEAALESHEEVLGLLGIRGVDAPHKLLQGSIKTISALITYLIGNKNLCSRSVLMIWYLWIRTPDP